MDRDEVVIRDLESMAGAKNYRYGTYRRLAPFIGQRILEVGAGIGHFTEMLLDRQLIVPTDKHQRCVDYLKARLNSNPKVLPRLLDLEHPSAENFEGFSFDTVLCLNVLEHVRDDSLALSFMHSVLEPGGRLVLLVPAFQFLYGSIDRTVEHHRRYTRKNLLPKMREAGFRIENASYMNMIGTLGWFWNNRVVKAREQNAAQVNFFDNYIMPWTERLERIFPPPFGLSLIAIGQRGERSNPAMKNDN